MGTEPFSDRLKRLVSDAGMSEADLASTLGVSANQAGRLLDGTTKTLKLDAALRLCRKLSISPWDLAGEPDPIATPVVSAMVDINSPAIAALQHLESESRDRFRALEDRVDFLTRALRQLAGGTLDAESESQGAQDRRSGRIAPGGS